MPAETPAYLKLDRSTRYLRWFCVAYIILLIVEGALRKWFLPSLSNVLLLIRDPIVLASYFIALAHGKFPFNIYVASGLVLVAVWSTTTLLFGHGDFIVTAFGVRANYFHIPMAFIMGTVFYRNDVIEIGKWWLIATLAMTPIITLQFLSPQSAWINLSVGGAEGGGFSGALGRYRPPGTFSFITGVVSFYTVSVAFLASGLTQHKAYPKWLIFASAIAIIIAIPVSISRSLILSAAITLLTAFFVSGLQRNTIIRLARIAFFGAIAVFAASQIPVFDEGKEAFLARWEHATGDVEGGVGNAIFGRVLDLFVGPFLTNDNLPFLGVGIGAGTQVGNQLLRGDTDFGLGEGEWFRLVGEGGIILGGLYILWRVSLFISVFFFCFRALRSGNGMGLILLSASALTILIGQYGQTTMLGFVVVGLGLSAAAVRDRKEFSVERGSSG